MSDRRVSKEELEAFWRGDKDTYQRMYSDRMQQKANEAEKQGKQVTYIPNDGSATLPEVSVTAPKETVEQRQAKLKQDYENLADNAITVAGFIPGADTFADIADIGNSWRKGDYFGMLWGLAGLGLPISGKALKSGWNWFKNLPNIRNYKATREISSAINNNVKDGIQVGQYYHGSPSRNITNFKLGKDGGIYWTHNKDAAKQYTGLFGTGKVYNADLNLGDKIVTIDNNGQSWTKIPENEVAKAFNLSTDQVHGIIGNYNLGATPWHYEFTKMFGYKPKTNYYAIDQIVKLGKNQGISSLVVNNVTDNGKRLFSKTMPYDQTIVYNPGQVMLNKNQTSSLKQYGTHTTYEEGPSQLGYTTLGVRQIGITTKIEHQYTLWHKSGGKL